MNRALVVDGAISAPTPTRTGRASGVEAVPGVRYGYVLLVLLPLLGRWLLPITAEETLRLWVFGFPILALDLAWGMVPIYAVIFRLPRRTHLAWALYYLAVGAWFAVQILLSVDATALQYVALTDLLLPILFLSVFPAVREYEAELRVVLGAVLVYLAAQILVFSVAPDLWSTNVGRELYEGGLSRIVTTVGAATGTAAVVFLVGVWLLDLCAGRSWMAGGVWLLTTVSIALTFSRAAMLAWLLFSVVGAARGAVVRGVRFGLGATVGLALLAFLMVSGPYVASWRDRVVRIEASGDFTSGRVNRFGEAWAQFRQTPLLGVGFGAVYERPRVTLTRERQGASLSTPQAPHNAYFLTLAEVGVVGSVAFWVPLIWAGARAFGRDPFRPLGIGLLIYGAVILNTECIVLTFEYVGLLTLCVAAVSEARRPVRPLPTPGGSDA